MAEEADPGTFQTDPDVLSDAPWRKSILNWDRQEQHELQMKLEGWRPKFGEEDRYNLLFLGEIGVGKTSFVNTALSVLRNEMLPMGYTASDDKSVTTKVQTFQLATGTKLLPIYCTDLRGYELPGVDHERRALFFPHIKDIERILEGEIQPGYELLQDGIKHGDPHYDPEHKDQRKIHAVIFVTDVTKFRICASPNTAVDKEIQEQFKMVHQLAEDKKIKCMVLANKVDNMTSEVKADIRNVFRSQSIQNVIYAISQVFGVRSDDILFQKNCTDVSSLDTTLSCLTLHNISHMLTLADLTMERKHGLPPLPPRELLNNKWRADLNMSVQNTKSAIEYLEQLSSPMNIVLMGLQSAGKTEIVNSMESALHEDLIRRHKTGQGERPVTNLMTHHALSTERGPLNIHLLDTTGLTGFQQVGMHDEDIQKTLEGQIPDGYPYNPLTSCEQSCEPYPVHVAAFVINGRTFSDLLPSELAKVKEAVDMAKSNPRQLCAVLVSHMDELCAHVKQDVKGMFYSQDVQDCLKNINQKLDVQLSDILPIVNYTSRDSGVNPTKSALLLQTLAYLCKRAQKLAGPVNPSQPPAAKQSGGWFGWLK